MDNELSYNERITKEYEKYCLDNNIKFYKSSAKVEYQETFNKKLIENNELDYIVEYFGDALGYQINRNEYLINYIKENINKISEEDLNRIYVLFTYKITRSNHNDLEALIQEKDFLLKIAEKEKKSLLDLKKLDHGGYSEIYILGNEVIKIGHRESNKIIDNKRIFYPYFKGYIGHDYIESTKYINHDENFSLNDIKNIYFELRDQGIMWLDPRGDNLRKLNKDDLKVYNENRLIRFTNDIIGNNNYDSSYDEPLKENDYVIIDLDHMVDENDTELIEKIKRNLDEDLLSRIKSFENDYIYYKANKHTLKK